MAIPIQLKTNTASLTINLSDPVVTGPILKRWNGSEWVAAVVKHGSGWPTVQMNTL